MPPLSGTVTMAHYDIFRHHLSIKFPACGFALWDPDPGNLYPAVEVGDVGYICEGKFHRLFNVLLPANHPSHRNFGVPEYHQQLTLNMENHINICNLSPNNFCSSKVTLMPVPEWLAAGPDEIPKVTFWCPMKEGAVLCLPIQAKGENTVASVDFGKWIIKHIDRWFAWARQLGVGINRMEDIILVTGNHRTRSWTNVAFPGGQDDAQASFGAKVDNRGDVIAINWQFSHERNRGAMLNCGPNGEDLPEDQCIFIRGFRVARKLKILLPRLKGAAGPNPDPKSYEEEPDAELIPVSSVPEYLDPLHILLEYLAEEAPPNCDMVLVHDDDLARLDGIYSNTPFDALQPDILSSRIRNLKPTLYNTQIDLSSVLNSASADTESACVTTLSNIFENHTSMQPQSLQQHGASEGSLEGSQHAAAPISPVQVALTARIVTVVPPLTGEDSSSPSRVSCRGHPPPSSPVVSSQFVSDMDRYWTPALNDTSVDAGHLSRPGSHNWKPGVGYNIPSPTYPSLGQKRGASALYYDSPTIQAQVWEGSWLSVGAGLGTQQQCSIPGCNYAAYYNVTEEEQMEYCGHDHELLAVETGFANPCTICKMRPRRSGERVCGRVCREKERQSLQVQGYYDVRMPRRKSQTKSR